MKPVNRKICHEYEKKLITNVYDCLKLARIIKKSKKLTVNTYTLAVVYFCIFYKNQNFSNREMFDNYACIIKRKARIRFKTYKNII